MKLQLTKKTILHFLEYNWFIIIGTLILSYATFYVSFHSIHAYKTHEKVDFFIEGQYIKDTNLEYDLINNIEGLYEVNYHIAPSQSESLYTLYEGYFNTSDIYILREQDFIDMQYLVKDRFINIGNDLPTYFSNTFDYFTLENNNYAIKIYDKDDNLFNEKMGFINFIEFDKDLDDYYLAFNKNSLKFGLNNESNSIAIDTVNYLFRRYQNGQ